MDSLKNYRSIIRQVLTEYASIGYSRGDMRSENVFDETNDRYLLLRMGWDGPHSAYGVVIHLDIIDGKIWLQCDNTDAVVAHDLEWAGVPKKDIVLGFQPPEVRPLTDYAVA
ncbi:MAG: XisI protein [Gemmataceae bacterium]|nr:XisI protein [Gemmataceae bacterium]